MARLINLLFLTKGNLWSRFPVASELRAARYARRSQVIMPSKVANPRPTPDPSPAPPQELEPDPGCADKAA